MGGRRRQEECENTHAPITNAELMPQIIPQSVQAIEVPGGLGLLEQARGHGVGEDLIIQRHLEGEREERPDGEGMDHKNFMLSMIRLHKVRSSSD